MVKLNTDQNPYTAKKYQIQAVPTFVVFRGLELGKLIGVQSIDNLKSLLERYKTPS
ncbi:MAG: thioredoxin family protein [Armatimonadetes bacterium]|nr:thioredoxin family protein [Armatimonadota bacterium]